MMDIELVDGPLDGYQVTWRYGEPYDLLRFPLPVETFSDYFFPGESAPTEVYRRDCFRDKDHVLLYRWVGAKRKASL